MKKTCFLPLRTGWCPGFCKNNCKIWHCFKKKFPAIRAKRKENWLWEVSLKRNIPFVLSCCTLNYINNNIPGGSCHFRFRVVILFCLVMFSDILNILSVYHGSRASLKYVLHDTHWVRSRIGAISQSPCLYICLSPPAFAQSAHCTRLGHDTR